MSDINRRTTLRIPILMPDKVRVELCAAHPEQAALTGPVRDLSMGGMAVFLKVNIASPSPEDVWVAHITLPGNNTSGKNRLTLPCKVVNCRPVPGGYICGVRFLDIKTPARAVENRILWQFLLDEQRRWMRTRS